MTEHAKLRVTGWGLRRIGRSDQQRYDRALERARELFDELQSSDESESFGVPTDRDPGTSRITAARSDTPESSTGSGLIGLVIPDVGNPFYSEVAAAVEHTVREKGYLLTVANSESDPDKEQAILRTFCERGVNGLLVIAAPRADHKFLSSELHMDKRVVFIDRRPQNLPADFITSDNVGGARMAVQHLIEQGHTRIAMLVGDTAVWTDRERLQGYEDALAAAVPRIQYDEALVKTGCRDIGRAELATYELLDLRDPPTAIFAYNNRSAIGAYGAIIGRGSTTTLVGFDKFDLAESLHLTVVAQDTVKLGSHATEKLLARLSGDASKTLDERIPTELIVPPLRRESPQSGDSSGS